MPRSQAMRIAISTGGGDAPGLNAVIRAVVLASVQRGWECFGIRDGYNGLLDPSTYGPEGLMPLGRSSVAGITHLGGTILGTTNRGNLFHASIETSGGTKHYSARCVEMFHELKLDALVVIGGDGTLAMAHQFARLGIPLVGVPKTIDNDIVETTNTFGFDTAVSFATDAIDRLHTTAEAHHRVMVVEVMGRHAGWIALYSGVAGGADVILIPEIPYDIEKVARRIRERDRGGARFSIVVASEGATPIGGTTTLRMKGEGAFVERLGGCGQVIAGELERLTGKDARSVVLGHLQRGGAPTSFDRMLATRFGARAVELLMDGRFDHMVAFHPPDIVAVPLEKVVGRTRTVPPDFDALRAARALGLSLGD